MKFRLQLFGFDQSAYERPAQKWVCGWASQGTPCHRGPDAHGHCCGGMACQPKQNGSRWECARTAAAGGPCPDGPLPDGRCCQAIVTCRPVRSLRARRGLVVAWTFALTAGILCLGLARWSHFVSPGPLSTAHASLLAHGTAQGCAACHTAPHNWMDSLDRDRLADSSLCLKCHQNEAQFHGDFALLPHGLPASQLAVAGSAPVALATANEMELHLPWLSGGAPTGEIACSTCHHEHQGVHGSLVSMDNQTCQTCHTRKFQSFTLGHPKFTRHHEATNHLILFSHATHRDQHFAGEKFECAACHTPTPDGRITTASFEASCARCHSDHFNGKAEPSQSGIVLLQVPAMDVQSLKSLKVDIGQWPTYDGDPPVHLTPFMRLLLTNDHSDYLSQLPADLGQLADATDEQIAAVQQLAWSVKSLLSDAGKDVASLRPALAASLGSELSAQQFTELTAGLRADDVRSATDRWFPQLAAELQKPYAKWDASSRPKKPAPPASAPSAPSPGKKAPSDDLFNDAAPARNAPSSTSPSATPLVVAKYADDDLFNDSSATTKPSAPPPAAAKPPTPAKDSDDLFNDAGPATKPAAPAPAKTPAAASGDDLFNGDATAPAIPKAASAPAPVAAEPPTPAPAPAGPVFSPNGWERDDDKYALIYHPMGHANAFLRTWLEMLAPSSVVSQTPWKSQLLSADAGGSCTKCHNPAKSGRMFVWSPDSPSLLRRDFVKFSHRPHLLESALQDCSACHAMAQSADVPASVDPVSGFEFIQKRTCAACHTPSLAGDSCLTCHNYHITPGTTAAAQNATMLLTEK
jgi:hypothetical protein